MKLSISLPLLLQVQYCHATNPSLTCVITDYSFWSILTHIQCSLRLTCGLLRYLKLVEYTEDLWNFLLKFERNFLRCRIIHLTGLKTDFEDKDLIGYDFKQPTFVNGYRRFGGSDKKVKVTFHTIHTVNCK